MTRYRELTHEELLARGFRLEYIPGSRLFLVREFVNEVVPAYAATDPEAERERKRVAERKRSHKRKHPRDDEPRVAKRRP